MKKIISIVMVVAMIAALAFTVSADDTATAPTDGLLAHFTFDDAETGLTGNGAKATVATVTRGEGTVSIEDASGTPYDAVALVLEEGGDPSITDDAAIGSGAYQFDGTHCLNITKEDGSGLLDGVDSLTISYWAKHDTATQWPFFATPNAGGGPKSQTYPKETYLGILENSGVHAEIYNSPVNNNSRTYSTGTPMASIYADEWHHVVVVIDTDNEDESLRKVSVYVDGYFDSESGEITMEQHKISEVLGTDYSVLLGYASWGYNETNPHEGEFCNNCTIDDVYIYGRALSTDEIDALVAASAMEEEEPPQTDAPADDNTEKAPGDDKTTEKAPTDDKTTDKPADGTETSAPADEGGCGSTLGAAAAVVALTAVFGCAIVKKH